MFNSDDDALEVSAKSWRLAFSIVFQVAQNRDKGQNATTAKHSLCQWQAEVPLIFIPLPFVAALALLALLIPTLRNQELARQHWPFILVIFLSAIQSALVGLRWGYDITALRMVSPVIASCLPPLVYLGFCNLIQREKPSKNPTFWSALLLPCLMVALLVFAPELLDAALFVIFIFFASALLFMGGAGPDRLEEARFDAAISAHRALIIAAISLYFSAFFDVAVLVDAGWSGGQHTAFIIGNANLIGLFLIGVTALIASNAIAAPMPENREDISDVSAQDHDVLLRIKTLLNETRLYQNESLNLTRLARKSGIPSRQISAAVNRASGENVSRFINNYRIHEACRLLTETDLPVTTIMLDAGFQIKSNFNKEFRRVTATSPSLWRENNREKISISK